MWKSPPHWLLCGPKTHAAPTQSKGLVRGPQQALIKQSLVEGLAYDYVDSSHNPKLAVRPAYRYIRCFWPLVASNPIPR